MNISLSPVFFLIGNFLFILGLIMLGPAFLCYITDDPNYGAFLSSTFITLFAASLLILAFKSEFKELTTRQAFLLTFLTWTILSLFAAFPYLISSEDFSFIDAYFETMSGLTTTGASTLRDVEHLGKGIHLWRAFLAGFGGIGIIVLAIAVLPMLKIGGMQLLLTESSDKQDKFLPRTTEIAATITLLYLGLIVICACAYWLAGMTVFDAVIHGITTLSTSGISTHNSSFSYFQNTHIEWVASVFMLMGSLPFILYLKIIKGRYISLVKDGEVRFYVGILITAIVMITLYKFAVHSDPLIDALRKSMFHVISYASTTGFATEDITYWGSFPIVIILFLSMLGACSGSTAGGIKAFRFGVLIAQTRTQIAQLIHPKGVFVPYYNAKPIAPQISTSVSNYIFVYLCFLFAITIGLGYFGVDVLNSFSTAVACLSNVGASLTTELGPMGSYASIPEGGKWIMICGMLLGRLELFSVLVIFLPVFWKN